MSEPAVVTTAAGSAAAYLREKVGGLPRPFWALWAGTLVNRVGGMVQTFLALYLTQQRGLSLRAAGLMLMLYGVGALASQPIAGALADRLGRRATLAGGMLATAAVTLLLGYSASTPAIMAGILALGLVVDVYRPASNALVADLVPAENRPKAFGLLYWAVNLGFTVGAVTGGALAALGFTWLFWIDAAASMTFGLIVWRSVPESRPALTREVGRGGFGEVLRDKVMLGFTAISLVYAVLYLQAYRTLPLAMERNGLPPVAYGLAIAANGVIIVFAQPLLVSWLARRDHSRVLAAGMVIVGLGFGLTALASSTLGYTATVATWTIGEIAVSSVNATIVSRLAPPHLRGRYSGMYGLAWSLSSLLAPLLGSWLLGIGATVLWLTCGALGLAAAVGQLLLRSAIRRRTDVLYS